MASHSVSRIWVADPLPIRPFAGDWVLTRCSWCQACSVFDV